MPARTFTAASSEKIQFGLGAIGFACGTAAVAAIIRTSGIGTTRTVFAAGATATTPSWGLFQHSTNKPALSLNGGTALVGATATLAANKWYLIAASKASGTTKPRFHTYDYAANTWTHEDGTVASGDSGVPATRVQIGCSGGTATFMDGDIAVVGVWNVVPSDSQVEALAYDLMAWFAFAQPKGLWLLDQDAVAQLVPDLSGNGSNQSAITGTSLSTNSVPVFSRGVPVEVA